MPFLAACAADVAPPVPPRNVVIVVFDTARRDHFSTYGYERGTTPVFSAFAREGIRFDRAWATSSWTLPSHASLFTGQYPATHGAHQESAYLPDDALTLAERLAEAGYETAAFSGNPWVSRRSNLVQGFGKYEVVWTGPVQGKGSGLPHLVNKNALDWLDRREDATRPFLLFVNYIEPHFRYQAPDEYQRRFVPGGEPLDQDHEALFGRNAWYLRHETLPVDLLPLRTGMYDAELAYTDAVLGELLEGLRSRGLYDSALVVVTADHGENHGDGGHLGHVFALGEGTIAVPLAVRAPGGAGAGTVRTDPVQLTDVFATALTAAGLPVPEGLPALDLLGEIPAGRPLLAEYYWPRQVLESFPKSSHDGEKLRPFLRQLRAVRIGDDKLVWASDGLHELYDLSVDPRELENRFATDSARAAELGAVLDSLVQRYLVEREESTPGGEMDPEIEEQLRTLGYVE
jgi:arylsulfatase A-like enzyme